MMDMRNVRRRRRWATLAVILAAAAGLALLFVRGASSEQAATRPTASAAIAPSAPAKHKHLPLKPDGTLDHPTFSTVKMPPTLKKVLDDNPDLAEYYGLEQKVLPTDDERGKLHALLSDPDMLQQITDYLLVDEARYSKDSETKRMVAVEFLGDAVSWADNPARPQVMEAVQNVLFADNIAADAPDDLAQSLAGDKMELYTQLLGRSPDGATAIADAAKGKPVEALLTFAKQTYERELRVKTDDEAQHR
jgi:hypothetical protein